MAWTGVLLLMSLFLSLEFEAVSIPTRLSFPYLGCSSPTFKKSVMLYDGTEFCLYLRKEHGIHGYLMTTSYFRLWIETSTPCV